MSRHRLFQDDLASVSISLRASGVVASDTKSVEIVFGEGDDGSGELEVVPPPLSQRRRMVGFSVPCLQPDRTRP
jgi:hypothetical protein